MGTDFNASVVFPPDDTGFGFDNVGDALSLSPLLMEKYLESAKNDCLPIGTNRHQGGPHEAFDGKRFSQR